VFHLIPPEDDEEASEPTSPTASLEMLDRLRERACKAATEVRERTPREARRRYHERSAAVREYVLAEQPGLVSLADERHPFESKTEQPTSNLTILGGYPMVDRTIPGW